MQVAINESPFESKRKEGLRLAANTVRMTKEYLRKHCKDTKLYLTPNLNDVLYLHFKGFQKIENLDEYTGLKCLWLESNGLGKIENLDHQKELRSLYLHNNLLTKIENLEPLVLLDTINLCHNFICRLENLAVLPALNTLNISHNKLESVDDIKELEKCPTLSVVDLSHNFLKEQLILEVFGAMPCLRVLALTGNPVLKQWSFYRKKLIVACPMLMHLDDRPVFDKDRRCAEAWQEGGLDAEQIMRQTILNEEHLRIRASVDAVLRRRDAATMKRLEEEEERLGDVGPASDNDIVEESTSSESSADSDREDQEIGNELCSSEPEVVWGENQVGVKLRMPWQRDSGTIVDREKKKPLIEEITSEENVDTSKMVEICQLPPKDEICKNSNVAIDDKIIVTNELLMTENYETIVSENIEISQLPITNMLSETCHLNEKDKQNLADNFSKTEKDEEEMLKGDDICKLSSKLEMNDKDQGPLTEDLETLENLKDDMLKINEAPIQSTYSTGDSFDSCEISSKDEGIPIDELLSDNKYTDETLNSTYTNDNFLQDKGVTANLYDDIGIDVEEDKRKVRLEAEQLMKEILEDARRRSNLDMRDDFVMEPVKPKGKPSKYEDVEDYVRQFFTVNDTPELKVSCEQNKQTLEKKIHTEGKENISTEGAQKVIKRIELMKESERNENKANGMEVISKIQSARRYLQETKEETRNLADNISHLDVKMDANISEVEQMADSLRNKNKTLPEANQDEMGDTQTKRKEVELKDAKEPVKRVEGRVWQSDKSVPGPRIELRTPSTEVRHFTPRPPGHPPLSSDKAV
uniref:Dynein axonemal assembly factor 1 homolog n=1 Tax=Timema genevievae TaxID=629358 RepID=A0A7R9PMR9_TIMGE|nr:unnamed protein product [Timema genevievae]